jgi:hypothetical protein
MHLYASFYDRSRANEPDPAHQPLKDTRLCVDLTAECELADFDVRARTHGKQWVGA